MLQLQKRWKIEDGIMFWLLIMMYPNSRPKGNNSRVLAKASKATPKY